VKLDKDKIPELDEEGLRKFAFTFAAIIVVLLGLLIPLIFGYSYPKWPWLLAAILSVWACLAPSTLNPFYNLWMRFGLIMNRITTPIILGIVFFLVFTPVAFFMRLAGRDKLLLKDYKDVESYRCESTKAPKSKLERPF